MWWCQVVLSEYRVVRVLVDEVCVRGEHVAPWCPTEIPLCRLLVEDVVREDVRCSAVSEDVRVEWLVDACSREVSREEVSYRTVLEVFWFGRVLVVHPEWAVGVVLEGVVIQPLCQVWRAAHDDRAALPGFTVDIERVAVLVLRDVFDLEVADFGYAAPGLPEDCNQCFVAGVVADVQEFLDVFWGEEVFAF